MYVPNLKKIYYMINWKLMNQILFQINSKMFYNYFTTYNPMKKIKKKNLYRLIWSRSK